MLKFTYVVSIYNTAKYLRRRLDSLVGQTYKHIEILLVNDGSTDESPIICQEYADKYDNVVKLDKVNGGLADARNFGMKYASGDYIIFVDSDDWCELKQCEKLQRYLEKTQTDICIFGYFNDFSAEKITKKYLLDEILGDEESMLYSQDEIAEAVSAIEIAGIFNTVWNKAYQAHFLKSNCLDFEKDGMPGEDLLFNVEAFMKAGKVCILNELLYHYMFQDEITLSRKYQADLYEKNMQFCEARKKMHHHFHLDDAECQLAYARSYVQYGFCCIPNAFRSNAPKDFKTRKVIFQKLNKNVEFQRLLKNVKLESNQYRILSLALKLGPSGACVIYTLLMGIRNKFQPFYNALRTKAYKKNRQFS